MSKTAAGEEKEPHPDPKAPSRPVLKAEPPSVLPGLEINYWGWVKKKKKKGKLGIIETRNPRSK